MARGMVAGEAVVSQAQSRAFDEGAERLGLGRSDRARERGRFIWDAQAGKLVRAEDYQAPEAKNAPILADRLHEGTVSPVDGSDIGSRRKRREHAQRNNVTDASDFSPRWYEQRRKEIDRDETKQRRTDIDRALRDAYRRRHAP